MTRMHASPSANDVPRGSPVTSDSQMTDVQATIASVCGAPGGGANDHCSVVPSCRLRETRASPTFSTAPSDPSTTIRGVTGAPDAKDESTVARAPDATSIHPVNASSASQGWSVPSPSGRSGTVTHVVAPARTASPRSHRTRSIACDPKAPIQPPPSERSKSHPHGRRGARDPEV